MQLYVEQNYWVQLYPLLGPTINLKQSPEPLWDLLLEPNLAATLRLINFEKPKPCSTKPPVDLVWISFAPELLALAKVCLN